MYEQKRLEPWRTYHASRAAKRARAKIGSVWSVSAVAALECAESAWHGEAGHCRRCGVKLTGRRTAWCSDHCHRQFELNHIWDEARQHVLSQARWTCEREGCDVSVDLQVNHINPVVGQGYHPSCYHHIENLEALCRPHHQVETNKQRTYRKANWTQDPLTGRVKIPDASLPEDLRDDLVRRQLDRASGFPFIFDLEKFKSTGEYNRYRPNVKWAVAEADLIENHSSALLWSPKVQAWVSMDKYLMGTGPCGALTGSGDSCLRQSRGPRCWQHSRS